MEARVAPPPGVELVKRSGEGLDVELRFHR
jgi:hypothetical protein